MTVKSRLVESLAGAVTTAATLGAVLALPLLAHIPVFLTRKNATTPDDLPLLPDGSVSFAFYGVVPGGGESRSVQVELTRGQLLYAELLIPKLSPEQELATESLPTLTITAPSGAHTHHGPNRREVFDEPYTSTSYLSYLVERGTAEDGTYTLAVAGPEQARFVLAVGEEERPGDVLRAPIGSGDEVGDWYRDPAGGPAD